MPRRTRYRPPTRFSAMPPVIENLLILNGLVFIAQFLASNTLADGSLLAQILNYLALYPPGGPEQAALVISKQIGDAPGFWPWQMITYSFLHGGFGHLFINMLILWMFGVAIENQWGSRRFAVFYFICVVGAAAVHLLFVSGGRPVAVPTVGASGGVYGVLLAFGMMYPNRTIYLIIPPIPIRAKWFVLGIGAIQLYSAVAETQGGVANFAHLGGMVVGFLLIQYWRGKLPVQPKRAMRW